MDLGGNAIEQDPPAGRPRGFAFSRAFYRAAKLAKGVPVP
jgi:hypothetical protein